MLVKNDTSCKNISLHLSYNLITYSDRYNNISINSEVDDIDAEIFHSRPSSHFTLNNQIPRIIRNLISESEQARQANLLVGASACLRKAIYELIKKEKSTIINQKTNRINYKESIKNLKKKFNFVDSGLFDALSSIQEMIGDNLHENSWEAWDSKKLIFLIELVKAILDEIYVLPDIKKKRISKLHEMKSKLKKKNTIKTKEILK